MLFYDLLEVFFYDLLEFLLRIGSKNIFTKSVFAILKTFSNEFFNYLVRVKLMIMPRLNESMCLSALITMGMARFH